MRPRELTVRGFRSYRDEVTFDLRGRRLVGIVGPIGAGKSTILDAIAFALFGKTPRVQRDTKSLIHQLGDAAHVQLVFEVDGEIWRVTRALKRKGQGQVQLARLAEDDPEAAMVETVLLERPVRDRIERLLGMDFDTFGRSVLLAQNRFAEFLLAPDGPRNAVLKGVFGYERFDTALGRTRERVAAETATVAALDAEGARLIDARESLDAARAAAVEAIRWRDRVRELVPAVATLDERTLEARRSAELATEELARLERAAAGLPTPGDLDAVLDAAAAADGAVAEAEAASEAAETARRDAEAARDAAAERVGDLQAFADLVAQLHAHADAVTAAVGAHASAIAAETIAADALIAADADRAGADKAAADASAALAEAAQALAAADDGLHAARHAEMAAELRHDLVRGEPCPVCAQVVTTKPRAARSAGVKQAERTRKTAASRHEQLMRRRDAAVASAADAAAAAVAAAAERDRAAAASASAEAAARDAEAALAATKSTLVDRLGEGDPTALLEERQAELRDADRAAREALERERTTRASLDDVRRAAAAAAADLARVRERLAGAAGALGEELAAGPEIRDAFASLLERMTERAEAATGERTAATDTLADAERHRAALLEDAGLPADVDVGRAATEAEVRAAQAEERVAGLERTLADGADLDQRMTAARERLALAERLRADLQPSRFLMWLLDEERAALAELASVHLDELTDGDFGFADDGSFRIVDRAGGGAVRAADSLSGGETFLASLALALALAEMVTRGGGRLDAFFLDEGFGSLDPEHVERAMRGVEHLVSDGGDRLVILVSHVEQMHELLEDLIVLEKDDAAGTSRVLSGARPA